MTKAKITHCPTCGRPYQGLSQGTVKICRLCKSPIKGGKGREKWHVVTEDGVSHVQHQDCKNPTRYKKGK